MITPYYKEHTPLFKCRDFKGISSALPDWYYFFRHTGRRDLTSFAQDGAQGNRSRSFRYTCIGDASGVEPETPKGGRLPQ